MGPSRNTSTALVDPVIDLDIDPIGRRAPLVTGSQSFHAITEAVAQPVEWTPPRAWYIAFGVSVSMLGVFVLSIAWLFWEGVGIWGNSVPVAWAFDITNFVFWVGIGHAGTLISAILFLFRQRWRTSINRAAEAMTIFAVICALIFPGIHTGRPWLAYWMLPLPNQMGVWPQFRSPLMWDVFAVSIYFTVSLVFWYLGLVPDVATMRDRATSKVRQVAYGILALGWRGSHRHWHHYERAYLLLAGLATPLVLSVHSVVSFDFAVSQIPGWHTTIFPPYFVAGAIFSGMAMVVTLMVISRVVFKLEHLITLLHFDRMARLMLATSWMVAYAYGLEATIAYYSGNSFERFTIVNRALGPHAWAYWTMVAGNVLVPQVLWSARARISPLVLLIVSLLANVGMWFERFVIIVTSLQRDFLPSSWDVFSPTIWDISTLLGSFGLFFTLFCLFVRYAPMVAMAELKSALSHTSTGARAEVPDEGEASAFVLKAGTGPRPYTVRESLGASSNAGLYGVLATFETPDQLVRACKRLRSLGCTRFDAHSPFAVHGLSRAMGLRRSPVGWFVLLFGLAGASVAMLLQWWVSGVAYPLVVSGKPFFSWPAFLPITFECGILGGALGAIVGLVWLTRVPQPFHPLFGSRQFERVTDDGFAVSVEVEDRGRAAVLAQLLERLGATDVEFVQA
jgi:molybdopterin-containing oxidoreductase family membrane subunit